MEGNSTDAVFAVRLETDTVRDCMIRLLGCIFIDEQGEAIDIICKTEWLNIISLASQICLRVAVLEIDAVSAIAS